MIVICLNLEFFIYFILVQCSYITLLKLLMFLSYGGKSKE